MTEPRTCRRCVDCRGLIVYGPRHDTRVSSGGESWVETRCLVCSNALAWACWPEDWGPYPHPHSAIGGRC